MRIFFPFKAMRFRHSCNHRLLVAVNLLLGFVLFVGQVMAAPRDIVIYDKQNKPLAGAVVSLPGQYLPDFDMGQIFRMGQVNRQFVPHVLVVPSNSLVAFPNSDSIKHHVYSFSPAKTFQLRLYKGREHPPLLFDTTGVIELGCNVHDWMLGYIVVVDSHIYGMTDSQGRVELDLPTGEQQLSIWHTRFQDNTRPEATTVSGQGNNAVEIQIKQDLLPAFEEGGLSSEFDYE